MDFTVPPFPPASASLPPWQAVRVSLFAGARDARPTGTAPLVDVFHAIRTGTYHLHVTSVRMLRDLGETLVGRRVKSRLPAASFAGTFTPTRARANLQAHSGVIHGDIDHIDVEAYKHRLCPDPYVAYLFTSPSGDGLKMGVLTSPVSIAEAYTHAWQCVADYYHREYGVTWDPSGKDVCRLCFLSADAELFLRPDPVLFPVPAMPPAPSPSTTLAPRLVLPPGHHALPYGERALQVAVGLIYSSRPGGRHHARTRAAYLLGGYCSGGLLDEQEALSALQAAVERNTENRDQALKTVHDCFTAGKDRPITQASLARWRMTAWRRQARRAVAGKPVTQPAVSGKPITIRASEVQSCR
jgi:hypothetical protein